MCFKTKLAAFNIYARVNIAVPFSVDELRVLGLDKQIRYDMYRIGLSVPIEYIHIS